MSHIAKGEFTVKRQPLALEGSSGVFHIIIAGGRHSYEFAYKLP